MKLLQINDSVNTGSTGRIAEGIARVLISGKYQSLIAYGRDSNKSQSIIIRIGGKLTIFLHLLISRLFDLHGFGSTFATMIFINKLKKISPDIFHLHNIHGYYLNVKILFKYLKRSGKPVVWTLHDCWPFTGHCSYFDAFKCYKWELGCFKCPNLKGYPESWWRDNSRNNFKRKKALFTKHRNLTIIAPSFWLAGHISKSFLNEYPVTIIHNGIDLSIFKPIIGSTIIGRYNLPNQPFILGVANNWDKRKGLTDFYKFRQHLPNHISIVLVGLKKQQIAGLPDGITGLARTENIEDLAAFYSAATVFVNPTYIDNFPTTNLEALACGTPVITYNTGGSPEAINELTGFVIEQGDIMGMVSAIREIIERGKDNYSYSCRALAQRKYNQDEIYMDYFKMYENILKNNNA